MKEATKTMNKEALSRFEMAEIFEVKIENGAKIVNRFGYFSFADDNTCAVYKHDNAICDVEDFFDLCMQETEPADIERRSIKEVAAFVQSILEGCKCIDMMSVCQFTPCGWYYAFA